MEKVPCRIFYFTNSVFFSVIIIFDFYSPMTLKQTFFFFILLIAGYSQAQVRNPLVTIKDLTFDSPFEEKIFNEISSRQNLDLVKAFVAADGTSNEVDYESVQQKLDEVKKHIKVGTDNATAIRSIHNAISIEFAVTYDAEASFRNTVEKGIYNSYTLTAVYGYLFRQFGIGYSVRETEKAFLSFIADPDNENFVIETGKMVDRYFEPLPETKEKFAAYLFRKGIIKELELRKTASVIWDQHSVTRDSITALHLLSLYYLNKGLMIALDGTKHIPGRLVEKSCFLLPTHKNKFYLPMAFSGDVEENTIPDSNMVTSYIKYVNYIADTGSYHFARDWFINTFTTVYIERDAPHKMEHIYKRILNEVSDSVFRQLITAEWYFQLAKLLNAAGNHTEIIALLDSVHIQNPENEKVLTLLVNAIFEKLSRSKASDKVLITELDKYCIKYKKMRDLEIVRFAYAIMYLNIASSAFYNNDIITGVSYMNKYKTLGPVKVDYMVLGEVYSEWSSYYARKNDTKKARQYLMQGLEVSPNNPTLKRKLKLLDDYTKKGKY